MGDGHDQRDFFKIERNRVKLHGRSFYLKQRFCSYLRINYMSKHGNADGRRESVYLQLDHFFLIKLTLKTDPKSYNSGSKFEEKPKD